ncbi:MAG: D-alanyl-D-alanine carboxypeptidase/D-alanyl-D-alanine-endopeptidase [Marinibacterium sp.]|nr:D-alanyl-D-alanine carboxypeptidase/D-alanyl-D-alanine-endopeptidase [Marinibacterium sp.]
MTSVITRRHLLGSIAACAASAAGAAPLEQSARPIPRPRALGRVGTSQDVLARFGFDGVVSCAAVDLKTGKLVDGVDPDRPMPPASVAKALTALYALDRLGPGYRFVTRVMATGPVENGILRGDLVLAGGGDPELDTNALAALAADLKTAGLREVRGDFIVYDGAMPRVDSIDPGQLEHVGYSPALSGIALNFNRVHFEWRRAGADYSVSMDARSNRYRPDVAMARMEIRSRSAPVYTYEDGGRIDRWTVARGALGTGGARWLPVRKPGLYAGDVFQTMARAQGIVLRNPTLSRSLPQGRILARHDSRPLVEILQGMLEYSTNLTAEMVGLAASARGGNVPEDLAASAAMMNAWAADELGMTRTRMVDHSGLGGASRISARDLAVALASLERFNTLGPILSGFTLRDIRGQHMPDHPVKVSAKTGSLNFVSCLGGYARGVGGRDLAFAIFTANLTRRAAVPRSDSENPPGARSWNSRSRRVQSALIDHWGRVHG